MEVELERITAHPLPQEVLLKFLIVGDYGVGKTSIVRRYTEGKFSTNYKLTIGAEFSVKTRIWDAKTRVNIQMWDIAGHEKFGHMTRVYYRYASAALVVFDASRIQTFDSIIVWINDVRNKILMSDGTKIPIVILANKCDVGETVIPIERLRKICLEEDILEWFSTSAKNNINIDSAIDCLIQYSMDHRKYVKERTEIITMECETMKRNCCF